MLASKGSPLYALTLRTVACRVQAHASSSPSQPVITAQVGIKSKKRLCCESGWRGETSEDSSLHATESGQSHTVQSLDLTKAKHGGFLSGVGSILAVGMSRQMSALEQVHDY